MKDKDQVIIIQIDRDEVPRFPGWFGGLWSLGFYIVRASSRLCGEVWSNIHELRRQKALAKAKLQVCKSGVHQVAQWYAVDGAVWRDRETRRKFVYKQGRCQLCGTIDHARFFKS